MVFSTPNSQQMVPHSIGRWASDFQIRISYKGGHTPTAKSSFSNFTTGRWLWQKQQYGNRSLFHHMDDQWEGVPGDVVGGSNQRLTTTSPFSSSLVTLIIKAHAFVSLHYRAQISEIVRPAKTTPESNYRAMEKSPRKAHASSG